MDVNGDGHFDILSGSYSRMDGSMAGLFQILLGKADGTFKKAAVLNGTDGKPLVIPNKGKEDDIESICTRPTAVDWDGDGDMDLVVGNFSGKFYLFTGEGRGKFSPKPQQIKAGENALQLDGHHGDPFIVDWDGDGDLDLLSGSSSGGVQWAENKAGAKKPPALKPFAALIAVPSEPLYECRPDKVTRPAHSTRVWVADVNSDGKLDLVVGDCISLISPAEGVKEDEFVKRYAEWKSAYGEAIKEPATSDEKQMEEAQQRMKKLYAQREEFMEEDRTGFVWLYLQK